MKISGVPAIAFVRNRPAPKSIKTTQKTLLLSREARKQLNAGARLDPEPPRPIPILEEVFDDSWLYTNARRCTQRPPFVNPKFPFISKPSDARGFNSVAARILFEKNLTRDCKSRWHCDLFSGYWFPAWHPIALARKSRPAIAVLFKRGEQYNGEKGPPSYTSKNPFHFAVYRVKTSRMMRRALARAWLDSDAAPDGLFLLFVNRVPRDLKLLAHSMAKFIASIARSDPSWAEKQAAQVDILRLNHELSQRSYPSVLPASDQEAWARTSHQEGSAEK